MTKKYESIIKHIYSTIASLDLKKDYKLVDTLLNYKFYVEVTYLNKDISELNDFELVQYKYSFVPAAEDSERISGEYVLMYQINRLPDLPIESEVLYKTICLICDTTLKQIGFNLLGEYLDFLEQMEDFDPDFKKMIVVLKKAITYKIPEAQSRLAQIYMFNMQDQNDFLIVKKLLKDEITKYQTIEAYSLMGKLYLFYNFEEKDDSLALKNLSYAYNNRRYVSNKRQFSYDTLIDLVICKSNQCFQAKDIKEVSKTVKEGMRYYNLLEKLILDDIGSNNLENVVEFSKQIMMAKKLANTMTETFYEIVSKISEEFDDDEIKQELMS